MWTDLEASLAIICACLPASLPFFQFLYERPPSQYLSKLLSSFRGTKSHQILSEESDNIQKARGLWSNKDLDGIPLVASHSLSEARAVKHSKAVSFRASHEGDLESNVIADGK